MGWIRRNLRGSKVIVRVGPDGQPAVGSDGRVDVRYKESPAAKIYRASARNLEPTGDPEDDRPFTLVETETVEKSHAELGPDAIIVYTDGACSGNPGPMGIGVVLVDRGQRRELSEFLGVGTNNIAELVAIERALDEIPTAERARAVAVHTDSSYAIGLLAKNFKAKANAELVARLRAKTIAFPRLRFVKVEGHSGVPENERCDALARAAVVKRG